MAADPQDKLSRGTISGFHFSRPQNFAIQLVSFFDYFNHIPIFTGSIHEHFMLMGINLLTG